MNSNIWRTTAVVIIPIVLTFAAACQRGTEGTVKPPIQVAGGGEGAPPPPPPTTRRALIYQRNHGGSGGPWDLRRIDADGTNDVQLLADGAWNIEPTWNCRKRAFIFSSNRTGPFLLYASDDGVGGSIRAVTGVVAPGSTSQHDRYPSWSTGDEVVFTSNRTGNFQLWSIKSNGARLHQVMRTNGTDSQPVWKPIGGFIAFSSDQADSNFEIFSANNGGTGLIRVTRLPLMRDVHPTWSVLDEIVYESSNPQETETNLVLSPAAGGDPRTLTSNPILRKVDPAFSPDGQEIAYAAQDATGQFDLFTMARDGTNVKQITNTPNFSEREPEWIHGETDTCL